MIKRTAYFCGECIEYVDEQDLLHREDGPAIEYISGSLKGFRKWYINGMQHNEKGAAVIYTGGNKIYWFKDKHYKNIKSDEQWIKFVKALKLLG